mgnify:CR=1 FL=1
MTHQAYGYTFDGIEKVDGDPYQTETLKYSFRSSKSGHHYQVRIEQYRENLCSVKFFDDTVETDRGKFSQLSGTYEVRTILRTVTDIALDVLARRQQTSFFFIGATDERDNHRGRNRRYHIYISFLKELDIGRRFRPVYLDGLSACLLVNTQAVNDIEAYVYRIIGFLNG